MEITLATLPQATAQQVFDQVAEHLLTQAHRSLNEYGCAYRGLLSGDMCAAGCLISDSEYNVNMEDRDWASLIKSSKVPRHHTKLIADLQSIHDLGLVKNWPEDLTALAYRYSVRPTVVTTLTKSFNEKLSKNLA